MAAAVDRRAPRLIPAAGGPHPDRGVRELVRDLLDRRARGADGRGVARRLAAADRDATLARLSYVTDVAALKDCDIVIEAVTEDLELKNDLWKQLDALCPAHTIFASNTSTLPWRSHCAARPIWVLLPAPSPPSKHTKTPRSA